MKIIAQIYIKLLDFFKRSKRTVVVQNNPRSPHLIKEEYIGSLSFNITKNREIDISCTLPDLSNQSPEHIKELSEIYAEFLVYINEGFLKDDILNILDRKDHNPNLTEDQQARDRLFVDNVLFNWALLHVENINRKKQSKKENQPLIRPITVFNPI